MISDNEHVQNAQKSRAQREKVIVSPKFYIV